jgi:hypothetical protein
MSNRNHDEPNRTDKPTMRDASHTNPYTDESFGETVAYSRGRVAVVDGGEATTADADEAEAEKAAEETIGDVDHTPQRDAPDASGVYQRGAEGE